MVSKHFSCPVALRLSFASSVAALTAACSQSYDPQPARTKTGLMVSRPAFTEAEYGVRTSPRVVKGHGRVAKGGGHYKLGRPYKVAGRWYVPREDRSYDRQGIGSWYGDDFHGRVTANGEIFDMNGLTAAHPTFPLPSYAYVTNLDNGRKVLVRVNDRGPYVAGRIIDLSYASARAIGYADKGKGRVRVQYAGRAPMNGDDRRERQFLAEQSGSQRKFANMRPQSREVSETPRAWSPTAYRSGHSNGVVLQSRPSRERLQSQGAAYIQVRLFRDLENAERLRRDLAHVGAVEVAPMPSENGHIYRVRVGPIDAHDTERTVATISQRGVSDTRVVFE